MDGVSRWLPPDEPRADAAERGVRDSVALDELGFGVKALGTNPRPSAKGGAGELDVPVDFGGIVFEPGAQPYADEDGVVVLPAAS